MNEDRKQRRARIRSAMEDWVSDAGDDVTSLPRDLFAELDDALRDSAELKQLEYVYAERLKRVMETALESAPDVWQTAYCAALQSPHLKNFAYDSDKAAIVFAVTAADVATRRGL